MATETAQRDPNYFPYTFVSLGAPHVPTNIYVDETTHRLLVNAVISGGGASDGAIVDGASTTKATVFGYVDSNPLAVRLTDTNGDYVGAGGGTQYTDAGVPPAHPVGNAIMWSDGANWQTASTAKPLPITVVGTPAVTVSGVSTATNQTGGGQKTQIVDGSGNVIASTTNALNVNVINGAAGGTSAADGAAFTASTTAGTPLMGAYHSTIDTVADGKVAIAAIDSKRNLHVSLYDAAGNARAANVNASNQLSVSVDNALVLGAGSAVIGHVITDATSVTAATLSAETTKVIGVTRTADGAGNLITTNSTTYTAKFGWDTNLLGTLGTAFSTAGFVDIKGADGNVFVRQATASNLNAQVVGTIASGGTDSGNPVKIGGVFNTTQPTVTNGQRVDSQTTNRGALIVAPGVDVFNVTINAALPAGSAVIGHVVTDSGSVVSATLVAETTKVIGTVRTADGAGNLLTTNSTTYTAKFALDTNLLGTLGTAFSTAGKVDVKGADGDVFVRQTTGSNLHTVIDSGTITTVTTLTGITNALPAGTNLLGKVGIDQTTPGTTNAVSIAQIAGGTVATAATGIIKVGLTDGTGGAITSTGGALTVDTELPTAAAAADAAANPTAPFVISANAVFNGTSWDRSREIVDATNSTGTGIQAVGIIAQYDDVAPTTITEGQFGNLRMSANRNLYGVIRDGLGSERAASVNGAYQLEVSVGNFKAIDGQPIVQGAPGVQQVAITDTTGNEIASTDYALNVWNSFTSLSADITAKGAVPFFASALTNTATVVKPNNGNLYALNITNTNSADAYLQFFDTNSPSTITVGTTLPVRSFLIPGGDGTHAGAFEEVYPVPLAFRQGLVIAATTTATGGSAPTTGLVVNIEYL